MKVLHALALCAALASCAPSIKVTQDYDPAAQLTGLRTWAWQAGVAQPTTRDPRLDGPVVARVKSALEAGLAANGFTPAASPEAADFTVAYYLAIDQKLDVRSMYAGYGGYWGGGRARTVVDQYEVGMLIVDFINPKTDTAIWRGTAQSRINESRDPAERQALVQTAVDKLLAQFPPQPK